MVLLLRRPGREGPADVLAPGGGPRRPRAPDRLGRARCAAARGARGVPGDHRGGLVAQLRRALPAAPGAGGDRLGLGPGRGRRAGRGGSAGRGWPARRWRSRRSTRTSCPTSTPWPAARAAAGTSWPTRTSTGARGPSALARLQARRPEFRDLTLYYFGDTDPAHYGVVGRRYVIDAGDRHPDLPPTLAADTAYLAVSASLQWGPWGPPGYFRRLDPLPPVATARGSHHRDLPHGRPLSRHPCPSIDSRHSIPNSRVVARPAARMR